MNATDSHARQPKDGSTYLRAMTVDPGDLDLTGLRAHCQQVPHGQQTSLPRSNRDLSGWHAKRHFRLHLGHWHGGIFVLIRSRYGRTTGQIARMMGNYTGQDAQERPSSRLRRPS